MRKWKLKSSAFTNIVSEKFKATKNIVAVVFISNENW